MRLNKFERQVSTDSDNSYGEWAGLFMPGKEPNRFWLTTRNSTQYGEVDSSEVRLFVGESGRQALRPEVAYKHWFTHKLSLTPDLEG